MEKLITIGVAVYNVEKYLSSCLESVIAQEGDDIEIIVVDDGSTDGSSSICDDFAARDSRIKVFHKENGGASTVRNLVIENAQGDWLCFVDGDDMLSENAIDTVRENLSNEYQIIYFDAVFYNDEQEIPPYAHSGAPNLELTGDLLKKFMLQAVYKGQEIYDFINITDISPWGKAYNKAFIIENSLSFEPSARKGQDLVFSIYCIPYITKVLLVRKPTYLYRVNGNSISVRFNPKIREYINNVVQLIRDYMAKHPDVFDEDFKRHYYGRCVISLKSALELYYFNKSNRKPFNERKGEFEAFISQDWSRETVENCDESFLTKQNKILFRLIKNNDFKGLCRYFALRDMYNTVKRLMGKTSLYK